MSEFPRVDTSAFTNYPQRFSREQVEQAFDFPALLNEHIKALVQKESEVLRTMLDIAEADETKPGLTIRSEYKMSTEDDTYIAKSTVEFDDDVPRGTIHYAPATGFSIGPFKA